MRCFQPTSFYAQKRDASDPSFFEINPTSYYAIASIHGLPYEPYDLLPEEDIKPTDWHPGESRRPGGYCHHDDILFPTRHSPYVMFIEMLIYEAAKKNIVNGKTEIDYWNSDDIRQYYWKLTLTVKKSKVGSPFELCVFIDLPNANSSTPKSSPNFAGLVSIFARGNETLCAECLSQLDAVVNGSVDLTTCMQRLDVNLNLNDLNNPNNSELKPEQITIVAALSDGTVIDLEDAALVNADYWVFNEGPGHNHDYINWTQKYIRNIYKALTKSVLGVNQ
ncbi:hypothetical protein C2G38_2301251 [Gigaspora rosea]|uniref:Tyrosinase C-terminal domain-containing protein n=1 Tax=Gigaspora rosea TaxID=44941 RepID=A0A397TRD3_9GLOM|nr:hypothetical protein C2G38_2301251 [Gigaspora rosea]